MSTITIIQDAAGPKGPRAVDVTVTPNTVLGFGPQGDPVAVEVTPAGVGAEPAGAAAAAVAGHDADGTSHDSIPADVSSGDIIWGGVGGRTLSLPNPYPAQANAPAHPSILFFPEGWNGYKWWLSFTPLPGAVSDYENPSVVASNDSITWITPGTNPLVAKPTVGFNADSSLFMSGDGATMYLAYREATTNISLKIMHTTDGVNWSAPVAIKVSAGGARDYASPSIWWNGTGYTAIIHDLKAAAPFPVQRMVSSTTNPEGAWGDPVTVTVPPKSGRQWWHSNFVRCESGRIIGIMDDDAIPSAMGGGYGYAAESFDDGATFVTTAPIWDAEGGGLYRCALCLRKTVGGSLVDIVLGHFGTLTLEYFQGYAGAISEAGRFASSIGSAIASGTSIPPLVVLSDSFVRSDATEIGTSSSGVAYVAGSTWGISGNRAYPVTTGNLLAECGSANHKVSARLTDMTANKEIWLIGRSASDYDLWRVGVSAPTASGVQQLRIQQVVGGAVPWYANIGAIYRGDYLSLECVGAEIRVLVNGILIFKTLSPSNMYGTKAGLRGADGANSFVNGLVLARL